MNFRTTAMLVGLLLVLGVVLLVLSFRDDPGKPETDVLVEELVNAAVKSDQVDTVEMEKEGGGRLKLVRVGTDKWQVAEPVTARADSSAVTAVVNALFRAKPTTYGELSGNPSVHGLAPPGLSVTLRQGTERSSTVNVGDVTVGGSRAVAFVTTSTRKRPMAVLRSDLDALFRDPKASGKASDLAKWTADYRDKHVFTADARTGGDDVTSVKLTSKGKTLALNKTPEGWKFESPAGWGEADVTGDTSATGAAITGVRPLLTALTGMQASTAEDFIEAPKDLKEYGLDPDNPDRIRVELKTKDGPPEVVFVGKRTDPPPATPPPAGTPPPPAKVYAQIEGTPGVIRVSVANLDGLAAVVNDPAPLRDRTLLAVDRSRITGVDINTRGQQTRLRQSGATWRLHGGPGDPQDAASQAVTDLLNLLTERRTVKDFPPPNDANFTGPAVPNPVEVKLWVEGFEDPPKAPDGKTDPKAEPKPKGNPITVQIGKQEGDSVFVRRILQNGARNDFLLPAKVKTSAGGDTDVVATLAKTRLDLLDPRMKSFSTFEASRVTITAGGATTEVTFDEKADPPYFPSGKWTFSQPEPQKGRIADPGTMTDLLTLLSTQQAVKFIAEAPTDPQLAAWGLGPNPRVRVVVGLKPPAPVPGVPPPPPEQIDKERVWEFGNETDDKNHVYARQHGRAAVFTVPKHVADKFANPDLRDKTVLRFDVAKVKVIRMRGWKESAGFVTTLEFERKGSEWAVRAPAGYNVDPAKVNAFLGLLNGLRAKAFIPGTIKPEHGFPPEEKGLEVTLEREDGPPVSLNIAALNPGDGNNSYFAWTGVLPPNEQVFTVLNDPFKPYKEKPAAFAR